jgi:hypothetical protein
MDTFRYATGAHSIFSDSIASNQTVGILNSKLTPAPHPTFYLAVDVAGNVEVVAVGLLRECIQLYNQQVQRSFQSLAAVLQCTHIRRNNYIIIKEFIAVKYQ